MRALLGWSVAACLGPRLRLSGLARLPMPEPSAALTSFPWRLEQFDRVACGVIEQDLLAALTGNDIVDSPFVHV